MPIVTSGYKVDEIPQADGRRWVKEIHIDQYGKEYVSEYLASEDFDCEACMKERAEVLSQDIDKSYAIAEESGIKPVAQVDKLDMILAALEKISKRLEV